MPLRDHFHSPVDDKHRWDSLHGGWPMMICLQLEGQLKDDFVALPTVHLGGSVEIDVGAFEDDGRSQHLPWHGNGDGGVATAEWVRTEPTLSVETDLPDTDAYEVRIYDLKRQRKLVAAIEIVSPANKDRPDTRRAFVNKCAALLQQEVSVTIVDLVTPHRFNLYAELLDRLRVTDPTLGDPPAGIYAVACRGFMPRERWVFQAWHHPLVLGQPLPALPLWLREDVVVSLDLETTYEQTCRVFRIA